MQNYICYECQRQRKCLASIKSIVDAYRNGTIKVTTNNDDFDIYNHVYDISVIMGMISNHTYNGLDLPIPDPHSPKNKKGR